MVWGGNLVPGGMWSGGYLVPGEYLVPEGCGLGGAWSGTPPCEQNE